MKPFFLSTLSLLLTLFISCRKEKADSLGLPATEKIQGNILVEMQAPGTRYGGVVPFSFYCLTELKYPSSPHSIAYSITRTSNGFEIEFTNIEKVGLASAFGPALCYIPVDGLANGTYSLDFILDNSRNNYSLTVTNESYKIVPLDNSGNVKFTANELLK